MSKKEGRLRRWERNDARKRKRHEEVMNMLASNDQLYGRVKVDMRRIFGK